MADARDELFTAHDPAPLPRSGERAARLARYTDGGNRAAARRVARCRRAATRGPPEQRAEDRRALPIAGDDADAKATVGALIDQIGFTAVDVGRLAEGRRQQPDTALYGVELTAVELRRLVDG